MPALPGAPSCAENIHWTLLAYILLVPLASSACTKRELAVSAPETLKYTSTGVSHWMSLTAQSEFNVNNFCFEILFQASEERDIIRLEVIISYMKPRMLDSGLCEDKVTVYDGSSPLDNKLGDFCGDEIPFFESSGSSMLMVIETYRSLSDNEYTGFLLNYSSIDRDRSPVASFHQSQSTLGANTIVLATLSAVFIYCVLFVILYRKCKYARRVRHSLAVSGNVPGDLRVPLTTVQDQASLLVPSPGQNQLFHDGALLDVLPNDSFISRPGSTQGPQKCGRVRHPAGDTNHHQAQQLLSPSLCHIQPDVSNDDCSVYALDRDAVHSEAAGYIRDAHQDFQGDPSGVFYAGNVDELGILHPPAGQSHLAVSAVHPGSRIYACHRDNVDHSQGCLSGRTSPRDSAHGSSWRCDSLRRGHRSHNMVVMYSGSPQLVKNVDTEGQTLTFYGMIDSAVVGGAGATVGAGVAPVGGAGAPVGGACAPVGGAGAPIGGGVVDATGIGDAVAVGDVCNESEPPPSYEDAVLGNMQSTS